MSKPICRYIFETRSFILVFFWFSVDSYNVRFILLYYLYLYTYFDVRHNFHISWCWCRLTVTPPVSLVSQDLLTFPEHMSSLLISSGVRVARSVVFCVVFCRSLVLQFSLTFILDKERKTHCYHVYYNFWWIPSFIDIKMKNKHYHTVETIQISKS
jgi:hypothetical protein